MDRADLLRLQAEAADALIWEGSAEALSAQADALPRQWAAVGLRPADVLRELSDESLALAIQRGFLLRDAFEELFVSRYSVYLGRWFFRWGTDGHLAQDLTQSLFLRFYERRLASYQATDSFRAYLWRAAYNLWVEKACRPRRPRSLDGLVEPAACGAGPEDEAVARELFERVEAALGRLPGDQQRVLREAMNGKKADEIAAALGWKKRSVFLHLFRARRRLEQALALTSRPPRRTPSSGSRVSP
jgi:RNA polymerase sigma factor (sigma-70 family)